MKNSQIVYSTDGSHLEEQAPEGPVGSPFKGGHLKLQFETKGRKGKGVTVIYGLYELPEKYTTLLSQLKKTCGSGGAIKDNTIEIQGDKRQQIKAFLEKQQYKVKGG